VLIDSSPEELLRYWLEWTQPLARTRLFCAPNIERQGAILLTVELTEYFVWRRRSDVVQRIDAGTHERRQRAQPISWAPLELANEREAKRL
jgi:hypothetical protein